jgi:uncharacterized protein (DUF1697 family)
MASVVFFRAANVGGHQVFRPSALAKELADLDVVNIGAAGTFVVCKPIETDALKRRIHAKLEFKPELIICSARELMGLADDDPFRLAPRDPKVQRYITILSSAPSSSPVMPIEQPPGRNWEVRVLGVTGRFAASLCRRLGKGVTYPNPVCEKHLGVGGTTRNWNTILTVCEVLK